MDFFALGRWLGKQADLAPGADLQPQQERAVSRADAQRAAGDPVRLLLYHGLGSGKGLSSIAVADKVGLPYTAVVPASLRPNYRKEQHRFAGPDAPPGDVISYNALASTGGAAPHPESLVFDEAQRLRNPGAAQTRAALGAARDAKSLLLLSGTPVVNDPGDFAPAFEMLTGRHYEPKDFRDRYVAQKDEPAPWWKKMFGGKDRPAGSLKREPELEAALAGKVDYHPGGGAPGVKVDRVDVPVEMNAQQNRLYSGMYGRLPAPLRWKLEHDLAMSNTEIRRLTSFLSGPRQVGLSLAPFRKGDPYRAYQDSPKLQEAGKRLQETLQGNPRAKALVFSNFIGAGLKPYAEALQRQGVPAAVFSGALDDAARKKLVEDYNLGKLRVALLGPSGSEGLSTKGTRLIQLLDPHWNEARTRQMIGRGLRYDSHSDLPEDERQVTVERYFAKRPPTLLGRLARLLHVGGAPRPAADDYLARLAERKDQGNQALLRLLQRVGSGPVAAV